MTTKTFSKEVDLDNFSKQFCELFFSKEFGTERNNQKFLDLMEFPQKSGIKHVSYSVIANYIYDNDIEDIDVENNCSELSNVLGSDFKKEFIEKTTEYIKLAYAQKRFIVSNYSKLDEHFSTMEDRIKDFEDKLNQFEHNLGKIYAEFVTLLGIFTAIAFSIFGGLQIVSSLFSKLEFSKPVETLGFTLINGAIISIIIYGIIVVLFEGIFKLTRISYNASENNYPINGKLKIWILSVSAVLFIAGICLILLWYFTKK